MAAVAINPFPARGLKPKKSRISLPDTEVAINPFPARGLKHTRLGHHRAQIACRNQPIPRKGIETALRLVVLALLTVAINPFPARGLKLRYSRRRNLAK